MNSATWLPHPWLSSLLALSWLLLQHSLAPVHLLASALIGVVLPLLLSGFLPGSAGIRLLPAIHLNGVVLWDIVLSNIVVARLVLGPMDRLHPAWVPVPLSLSSAADHGRITCAIRSL